MNRPVGGAMLLRYLKDRKTLAPLCDILRVEYKLAPNGEVMQETYYALMEALIHQISERDLSIRRILKQLLIEIKRSKNPVTTKDEWLELKSYEGKDYKQ